MKNILNMAFLLLFVCAAGALSAQKDLPTGSVDIVKNFDARLLDAERVTLKPELPALDTSTRKQTYNVTTKALNTEYLPPKIKPLAMKGDALPKGYKGYGRLGGGLPSALFLDASYRLLANKKFDFGLGMKHFQANNSKKIENQRFSDSKVNIDGTYYFDQGFAVEGKVGYSRKATAFYGYNDLNEELGRDFAFEYEDVKQRFALFEAGAKVFNGERTEADFNYQAGFDVYTLQDNYSARENGFDLRINATKWFAERNALRIGLRTDLTNFRDTSKQSLNNFFLTPSFSFHGDRFRAKIGAVVASHEDNFSFFPDVELGANILEGVLGAFVGAEGGLQKNNLRSLSDYNPYIVSRFDAKNTRYFHFYGGVKGEIAGVDYNAQIGYKSADDLALFLLNGQTDSIARFNVLYDTVKIVTLKASISAPLFQGFEVLGTFTQNVYSPQNEEKAWHLPSTTINIGARYRTYNNKVLVKADAFLENGVPYLDAANEVQNLNTLFDISLGADYFISDNFGLFMQLNNLANNRRQRWQRYPTLGLNVLVGLTARF